MSRIAIKYYEFYYWYPAITLNRREIRVHPRCYLKYPAEKETILKSE